MRDKVVDASALTAVLFSEPEGASIAPQLTGARLFAPALLGFELGNACAMKIRRQPAAREALLRMYAARKSVRVETVEVEVDAALALALKAELTVYDASYLWLSHVLRADLITLDKRLARAAAAR